VRILDSTRFEPQGKPFSKPGETAYLIEHVKIRFKFTPEVFVTTHLTRKELKQDNVALKVEETFDFFNLHKKEAVRYAGIAAAVILVAAGIYYYINSQRDIREQMLGDAMAAQAAPVGTAPPNGGLSYPTETIKKAAVNRAYSTLISEHGGSTEAYIAQYTLAADDLDAGRMGEARKKYQDVADHANANYSSLAKLALAQIDFIENKTADARNILKDLQDHPTDFVSKDQATFTLAKGLIPTAPEEARKMLSTLAQSKELGSAAVTAMQELPGK
jgi:predicted negative regulator of RcsB-dependent stress response